MTASLSPSDFVCLSLLITVRMGLMPYDVGDLGPLALFSTHAPPPKKGGRTVWPCLGLAGHVCYSWVPLSDQLRFFKDYNGAEVMSCCCLTAPCLFGPQCALADNLTGVVGAMVSRIPARMLGTLTRTFRHVRFKDHALEAHQHCPVDYKSICRVLFRHYNFTITSRPIAHC